MTPTGWTIALRGKIYVITAENKTQETQMTMNQFFFEKFTRDCMQKLGIKERNDQAPEAR